MAPNPTTADTTPTTQRRRLKTIDEDDDVEDERPYVSGVNLVHLKETFFLMIVLLGSCVWLALTARNTITWHCQRFWGASADFWQGLWEDVHGFGGDETRFFFIGTALVTGVSFWGTNLLLTLIDIYNYPEWITQYKIQEDKNVPMDMKKFWKALRTCLFNYFIVSPPLCVVFYYAFKWRGNDLSNQLPLFHSAVMELIVIVLVEEIMFYYSHRLLHHPRIYKYIHKKHHEWTAPIGIIAIYAHPFEHVVSNLLPVITGPLLLGSHLATLWVWLVVTLVSTTVSHCGYHFPLTFSPEFHDFHHLKFNYCYGVLGILDRLHGTDKLFRESVEFQRHTVLVGTTPLSVQCPAVCNGKVVSSSADKQHVASCEL